MFVFNSIAEITGGRSIKTEYGLVVSHLTQFRAPSDFPDQDLLALVVTLDPDEQTPIYTDPTSVHLRGRGYPASRFGIPEAYFDMVFITNAAELVPVSSVPLTSSLAQGGAPEFTVNGRIMGGDDSEAECLLVAPNSKSAWTVGAPYAGLIPSPRSCLVVGDHVTFTGPFRGRNTDSSGRTLLLFDLRLLETEHGDFAYSRRESTPSPLEGPPAEWTAEFLVEQIQKAYLHCSWWEEDEEPEEDSVPAESLDASSPADRRAGPWQSLADTPETPSTGPTTTVPTPNSPSAPRDLGPDVRLTRPAKSSKKVKVARPTMMRRSEAARLKNGPPLRARTPFSTHPEPNKAGMQTKRKGKTLRGTGS